MVSCMGQGLCVPDTWLPILDQLCDALQNSGWTSGSCRKVPQVVADQVKSKFSSLRFYFHLEWEPDFKFNCDGDLEKEQMEYRLYMKYYDGMVSMAESMIYNLNDK